MFAQFVQKVRTICTKCLHYLRKMFALFVQNVRTTCTKYVHTKFQLSGYIQYLYERQENFQFIGNFYNFLKDVYFS